MSGRAARSWIILLGVGVVVGVGIIAGLALGSRPPLHNGKPISYWVDQACRYGNVKEMEEVKQIGPAAVPHLVDRLRVSKTGRGMWLAVRARLPQSFKRHFPDGRSAEAIHYGAIATLTKFGAGAKPAVPDLIRLLPESPFITQQVINALAATGPEAQTALPALKAALTNQTPSVRVRIASALWHIGYETNLVLQVCTNLMMSGTPDGVTMNAAELLSRLNSADAVHAAPFALRVLQGTNWSHDTRANAACVLGKARLDTSEIRAALLQGTRTWQGEILQKNCDLALWRLDEPADRHKAAAAALESIQTSGDKETKP